jgi:peptidyl-prolyl cis-trans isomerase D
MALINTLREKMGKVIVGFISFSIAAFVLTDLLGPNSVLLGGNDTTMGEIAGNEIKFKDFQEKLDELTYNFSVNTNRSPNTQELNDLRQQTWDALINENAFGNEYKSLGLEVTSEEVVDMVQGNNISPEIRQAFTDPETGVFDKERVVLFLQNLSNQPPQQQAAWYSFENSLAPFRTRSKYESLLGKTNFATKLEGKAEYLNASSNAAIDYLYVSYISIPDSTVSVTEAELKAYLSNNADKYKREESRSINYIFIPVLPSSKDSAVVLQDIQKLKAGFESAANDSIFARANSDGTGTFTTTNPGQVNEAMMINGDIAEVGTIVGPNLVGGKYVLYKMSRLKEGENFSAKASHILFKWDDESEEAKAKTKAEATTVLNNLKKDADFAEMARLFGTDGTASRGGDLGWFESGRMVEAFEEAVFDADNTGLIPNLVETQFGYHIIDVTAVKTNLQYSVAKIEREIIISDETRDIAYRSADMFAAASGNLAEFSKNAEAEGLDIKTVQKLDKNQSRIGNSSNARGVVMWAFATASVGEVSEVYELDEGYFVAALTGNQEKGTASLEDVRIEVETKVKNQKKAELITKEIESASGSLQEIATAYGKSAKVYSMTDLKLSATSLNSVGQAADAVGVAFSLDNGEKTKPFASDNGVLIVEMKNKTTPTDINDYKIYADQLAEKRASRAGLAIDNAIREFADITDKRYKFF